MDTTTDTVILGIAIAGLLRKHQSVKALDWRAEARTALNVKRLSPAQAAEVDRLVAHVGDRIGKQRAAAKRIDPLVIRERIIRDVTLSGATPGKLPIEIIARMLPEAARRITPAVKAAYARADYRTAKHSHVTSVVCVLGGPSRCAAESLSGSDTPRNVGLPNAYGRIAYSVATSAHTLVVSPTWQRDVADAGLAVIEGMLTLAAVPVGDGGFAGCLSLYSAAWARQGKGTSLVTERGVIARLSDGSFVHAKDVTHARKLARARSGDAIAERNARDARNNARAAARMTLDGWTVGELAVAITAPDSVAAGNCETGTDDWIERHFAGRVSATVGDVLRSAFATQDRVRWAVAACLVAVRRARSSAKKAA